MQAGDVSSSAGVHDEGVGAGWRPAGSRRDWTALWGMPAKAGGSRVAEVASDEGWRGEQCTCLREGTHSSCHADDLGLQVAARSWAMQLWEERKSHRASREKRTKRPCTLALVGLA